MLSLKEVHYQPIVKEKTILLVCDFGGTNCNFGLIEYDGARYTLLVSLHVKSKEITNFVELISDVIEHVKNKYTLIIKKICIAAAGVISRRRHYVKPTNLPIIVDVDAIHYATGLHVVLANDFEVIAYGIPLIKPEDIVLIKGGTIHEAANKAIIGAGTGLGKCILAWDDKAQKYLSVASEGGHGDFAAQSELEFALIQFIKETEKKPCTISWEDVLAGAGIGRIYAFFHNLEKKNGIEAHQAPHPDEIFKARNNDEICYKTYDLYAKIYARCAKDFALEALARNGIYIAGGIAAKNVPLFQQQSFINEFVNCGKQQELLRGIPLYVIKDYNVSLYGAAAYMIEHDKTPLDPSTCSGKSAGS